MARRTVIAEYTQEWRRGMSRRKPWRWCLSGGQGGRMEVLTQARAKPGAPLRRCLSLDRLPLSNLAHSGISDIWVVVQYGDALDQRRMANGRPWDLDRTHGGCAILPPSRGGGRRHRLRRGRCRHPLPQPAIHPRVRPRPAARTQRRPRLELDYDDVIAAHREKAPSVRLVTTCPRPRLQLRHRRRQPPAGNRLRVQSR